ncbi:hypothetical protein EVAR_53682_1 [Eumeta japonica]|uniref:Uncharacterized protein n=1 Tax=Eumeta variegata TaxID=151549 RepID=A0A4C1YRI1_EUMVA|nr:hypothetical protein EVAR_53682_1 [Eumeta japonica]
MRCDAVCDKTLSSLFLAAGSARVVPANVFAKVSQRLTQANANINYQKFHLNRKNDAQTHKRRNRNINFSRRRKKRTLRRSVAPAPTAPAHGGRPWTSDLPESEMAQLP